MAAGWNQEKKNRVLVLADGTAIQGFGIELLDMRWGKFASTQR